jgi:hypothetical protein
MRKEKKDMTEVVSRLRASLRKNELQSFRDGYAAGTEWAKNRAEAMQLKRLHDWRKEIQTGEKIPLNEFFIPSQPSVISLLTAKKIVGNQNFGQEAAEAFWENALGKDSCHQLDRDFLRGFVEGAADIWASVRRQVTIIDGRPDQED